MSLAESTDALLDRIRSGRADALGELFQLHRERLWRMLTVRLDRRLGARLSPDDVLQEAYLDVAKRIPEYLDSPKVPFYVWLRFLTLQRLQMLQRSHLGTARRDAGRERPLAEATYASSDSMAGQLVGNLTSPSRAAIRGEIHDRLRAALDAMDPVDREVLALRHFEEMSNAETAEALGISKDAASKRHVRALIRLREILGEP
ncbi:MAG: sigma-70 family RNA polymerase sigma factor [Planctomycetia bacterium]|nr:sigma-70 family RNA polymerase sigma factor [Planctomycetia bacterium]